MERGNAKHGARMDDELVGELSGQLGPGGSNREEWADPEPPADDDPPDRVDLPGPVAAGPDGAAGARTGDRGGAQPADQDEAVMQQLRHDMEVANDWSPGQSEG